MSETATEEKKSSSIGAFNIAMIVLAAVQIGALIFLGVNLFNGNIVMRMLKDKRYDRAVSLINKIDSLSDNDEISDEIEKILGDIETDFTEEKITYEEAKDDIKPFSSLDAEKYKKLLAETDERLSAVRESRNEISLGDAAVADKDYAAAFEHYGKIEDEKLRAAKYDYISDAVVAEMNQLKSGDKETYLSRLSEIRDQSNDKSLTIILNNMEFEFYNSWFNECENAHRYFGENSMFAVAARYARTYPSDPKYGRVDGAYKSYISELIQKKDYSGALADLDKNRSVLSANSAFFKSEDYENLEIEALKGEYEGFVSQKEYVKALDAARAANGLRAGSIDASDIIEKHSEAEEEKIVEWLSDTRKAKELSELTRDSGLDAVAAEIAAFVRPADGNAPSEEETNEFLAEKLGGYDGHIAAFGSAESAESFISSHKDGDDKYLVDENVSYIGVETIYSEATNELFYVLVFSAAN